MIDDLTKLRLGLRAMPVPEPGTDFVDRVLANATSSASAREPRGFRWAIRQPLTWWAAGAGAVAATIAWMALSIIHSGTSQEMSLVLAVNESREVPLVIDSERNLDGAIIRLYVSGSIALVGYENQHEVEWLTSLTRGANLLSLPVIAREPGDGLVVAEIEHNGRKRRVSVAMHVSPSSKDDTA